MKQELLDLIDDIKKKELLVIVEGIKDKKALKSLGVENIFTLKKPLYSVVEEISKMSKEVVILTDLDDKGKELYHKLSRDLQRNGVKVNNKLREALFRTPLRHIEGIDTYLNTELKL